MWPILKAAGYNAAACRASGCSWADVKTAGFTAAEARAAGCDVKSAQAAGYDLLSLWKRTVTTRAKLQGVT